MERIYEAGEVTTKPEPANPGQVTGYLLRNGPEPRDTSEKSAVAEVELVVDVRGRVRNARISRTSGRDDVDRWAMNFVRDLRFRPGRLDGRPVPVRMRFPVAWDFSRMNARP